MTNMTPEQAQARFQEQQMKQALIQGFNSLYKGLTDYILKLQTAPHLQSFCLMNLDQGAMWAREAIAAMPLTFQAPANETKPEEEKKEEASQEAKEESAPEPEAA